jgi:hypothetical protein
MMQCFILSFQARDITSMRSQFRFPFPVSRAITKYGEH